MPNNGRTAAANCARRGGAIATPTARGWATIGGAARMPPAPDGARSELTAAGCAALDGGAPARGHR